MRTSLPEIGIFSLSAGLFRLRDSIAAFFGGSFRADGTVRRSGNVPKLKKLAFQSSWTCIGDQTASLCGCSACRGGKTLKVLGCGTVRTRQNDELQASVTLIFPPTVPMERCAPSSSSQEPDFRRRIHFGSRDPIGPVGKMRQCASNQCRYA